MPKKNILKKASPKNRKRVSPKKRKRVSPKKRKRVLTTKKGCKCAKLKRSCGCTITRCVCKPKCNC